MALKKKTEETVKTEKVVKGKKISKKLEVKEVVRRKIPEEEKTAEILSVEKKLTALFNLQHVDTLIDKIRIIRGELPLEVEDLDDEIARLETRIDNMKKEINEVDDIISEKKNAIKESQVLIKKYTDQQMNVRNNREYDSLTKEIEFQNLEIELSEKKIKQFKAEMIAKKELLTASKEQLAERKADYDLKVSELNDIVAETKKEEAVLEKKSITCQSIVEERLLNAYKRIRKNVRNGLAIVCIERDACGGCFNKMPPQKQMEIRMHKKILVCEFCGRILVDSDIVEMANVNK